MQKRLYYRTRALLNAKLEEISHLITLIIPIELR